MTLGVLVTLALILFPLLLLLLYCRQDRFLYQPNRGTLTAMINQVVPPDGTIVYEDKPNGTSVTFRIIEVVTRDLVTLRGFHLEYRAASQKTSARQRMVQYMHGTRVYLPNKINFFKQLCRELQSDVVAFAYRGFSHSDDAHPDEAGFVRDIDAIS